MLHTTIILEDHAITAEFINGDWRVTVCDLPDGYQETVERVDVNVFASATALALGDENAMRPAVVKELSEDANKLMMRLSPSLHFT